MNSDAKEAVNGLPHTSSINVMAVSRYPADSKYSLTAQLMSLRSASFRGPKDESELSLLSCWLTGPSAAASRWDPIIKKNDRQELHNGNLINNLLSRCKKWSRALLNHIMNLKCDGKNNILSPLYQINAVRYYEHKSIKTVSSHTQHIVLLRNKGKSIMHDLASLGWRKRGGKVRLWLWVHISHYFRHYEKKIKQNECGLNIIFMPHCC